MRNFRQGKSPFKMAGINSDPLSRHTHVTLQKL